MFRKRKKYDVFISYRRDNGATSAELVRTVLVNRGYKSDRIFMDTHDVQGEDFRSRIQEAVAESVNMVVILSKGCFDNIRNEDWFVFELSEAVRLQKKIVFCCFDFAISDIDTKQLPDILQSIRYQNAITYNHEYAPAFYDKLVKFLSKGRKVWNVVGVFAICLFMAVAGVIVCHNKCPFFYFHREEVFTDSTVVDLGLPSGTLWATCNLGANNPSDYGSYYMWGSVDTVGESHHKDIGYFMSGLNIIGTSYDAASLSLGIHWRLPSEIQMVELIDKCNWVWTNVEGSNGYEITGPNGQTLFLPVAGCVLLEGYKNGNQFGYYWIGERCSMDSKCAKELVIGLNQVNIESGKQYVGRSIRPVFVSDKEAIR